MDDEEGFVAHQVSEQFQEMIVQIGKLLLEPLSDEQREYVIYKAENEFRFWRVEDALK